MRVPLIYKNAPQFGFDISTRTVKVVQLRTSGDKTVVQGYGACYFPPDMVAEGIIVDPAGLAKAIKPMFAKLDYGKITSNRVVTGLAATKLFTRTLQLPVMAAADLEQAIHYEVEQYVPVPLSDLYIDYEVIDTPLNKEGQASVLMMAAPRAIVDSYLQLFDHLGLEVGAIEADMTAVVRAVLHSGDAEGSTLMIDIGSTSSDLTIYDKYIPLTGSIPIGGQHYTDALVKQLGVKADQASEIKEKFGVAQSGMYSKVFPVLESQLQALVKEARRVVKYYESHATVKDQHVASIVISGGSAMMPGIDTYLSKEIGLPLKIAQPWRNLTIKTEQLPADAPKFANAIGLALRGLL